MGKVSLVIDSPYGNSTGIAVETALSLRPGNFRSTNRSRLSAGTVFDFSPARSRYLLGDDFSVADLNVASIFSWAKMARLDFDAYPKISAWLNACFDREGYQRMFALR